jgi:CRP-like cAMP-binding protein
MVLSWLSASRSPPTVDELVSRGKYTQAIALLRGQFEKRQPSAAERLRFVDLLVLAGRGQEASPILLGLADEQARYGFHSRALEALRRADAIEPGRREVRRRFEALALAMRKARPESLPSAGASASGPRPLEPPAPEAPPAPATPQWGDVRTVDEEKTDPFGAAGDAFGHPRSAPRAPDRAERHHDRELYAFVLALGERSVGTGRTALAAALFADLPRQAFDRVSGGLRRRLVSPGDILVTEGEPGDSIFLITRGSVRIVVIGGSGRPFEIRRLDAGDFFGEVAALSGRPRTATVVAAAACELLEVDRSALDTLVMLRPPARSIIEDACVGRVSSPEESAVRSLPAEAASPERAAAALKAHFGGCDGSPLVRISLARVMLDAGQEDDALAVLVSVAEELAESGEAEKAIAILKHVERIRRRAEHEVCLTPLRKRARTPPRAPEAAPSPPLSRAAVEAAFREWLGSLAQGTDALEAGPAAGAEQEHTGGEGDGDGCERAGDTAEAGEQGLRREAARHQGRHQNTR